MADISFIDLKGMRTDRGAKFISADYLFDAKNINCDDLVGYNKILMPEVLFNGNSSDDIDGIFEFIYTNGLNESISESLVAYGGNIYKNFLTTSSSLIKSGMTVGKCSFGIKNNKLYIFNGLNFPVIYDGSASWEMGAPKISIQGSPGPLIGAYYYAVTFVTSSGEEYIGTVSNTVTAYSGSILLDLPIGYTGTISRNIYRTSGNGSILKLVTNIPDNATEFYTDSLADGVLGVTIISVNNECPKPKFVSVNSGKLIGTGDSNNPTRIWISDINRDVFDAATYQDTSSIGDDNSNIIGMIQDYSLILIGTTKNLFILDVSGTDNSLSLTRSNVGFKDGYAASKTPTSDGDFAGGAFFVSSMNDIRLFNGNFAQPVPTSLDNLKTDNFSQSIYPTLGAALSSSSNLYSEFFNYKYHVIIGDKIFVYDIRTNEWFYYQISTDTYTPTYNVFGLIGDSLYIGQKGSSIVEKMYSLIDYRNESCSSVSLTPKLIVDENEKYIKELHIYFVSGANQSITCTVKFDADVNHRLVQEINLDGGSFSGDFFSSDFFNVVEDPEDFRVIYLNRYCRWLDFKIESDTPFRFRGYRIVYDPVTNKE